MYQNPYIIVSKEDVLNEPLFNRKTGDNFKTEISKVIKSDLRLLTKSKGWRFNWKDELNRTDREVYKLSILNQPDVIHGLMSLTIKSDHVFINVLESASFNIGRNKIYEGVPGNLVAYACKLSFQRGGEGFVSFKSKTALIDHYIRTLEAYHFGGQLMVINSTAAKKLIDQYNEI